jgi:hypothetical protein
MLESAGALIIRRKKHIVYQLANGKKLVLPNTGSDHRGVLNAICELKRLCAK